MDDETFAEWARLAEAEIAERLRATYSEQVLARWRRPHNPGAPARWDGHAHQVGECGDGMEFWLVVEGERLARVHFATDGCGSSVASGSAAAELAEGLTLAEARAVTKERILEALGDLPPGERHCAALAANTLQAAVRDHLLHRAEDPWKKLYR